MIKKEKKKPNWSLLPYWDDNYPIIDLQKKTICKNTQKQR